MNEFFLVFHSDQKTQKADTSPQNLKNWADWFRGLAANNKLARPVQHIEPEGIIVNCAVSNGPFNVFNYSIAGLIIIYAASYNEAVEIAKGCPLLKLGGTVEIRKEL